MDMNTDTANTIATTPSMPTDAPTDTTVRDFEIVGVNPVTQTHGTPIISITDAIEAAGLEDADGLQFELVESGTQQFIVGAGLAPDDDRSWFGPPSDGERKVRWEGGPTPTPRVTLDRDHLEAVLGYSLEAVDWEDPPRLSMFAAPGYVAFGSKISVSLATSVESDF